MLVRSFWGAVVALLAWLAVLWLRGVRPSDRARRRRRRPQHYVQAMCHMSVYTYWGWYWAPVYDYVWLLVAQLVFAYAFDMLLSWSRRGSYVLGFGPLPIVFSTNLFLWFRDDWFYLQFLLVAVGFLGKEFVRWERDGKRVHIFNPSAFTLGALLARADRDRHDQHHLGPGDRLDAQPRAVHLRVPVPRRAGRDVLLLDHAGGRVRGRDALRAERALLGRDRDVPYFLDSEIPTAVFLGLHLLVTDPSTSPRTPLGRTIFGVLYGLGVFGLYALLGAIGAPTFYDKLLCVPLLNLLGAGDRSRRARRLATGRRITALRLDGPLGRAQPGAHGRVDRVLRRDDRARLDRRHAPRRSGPVLAAGLRRGAPQRLRPAAAGRNVVLHRQRRVGLQRAGHAITRRAGS